MRKKDENKESVIREKAIEMIVQEGFDGLSMHKLAKAANISASTIYIYFENREDLLNKLFIGVEETFIRESLIDFDPTMSFEEGLWRQWQNRYTYILNHETEFHFSEHFRHSPLIRQNARGDNPFKKAMREFVENAVSRGELLDLPPEVYWSIAYGPLYTLVKIQMEQCQSGTAAFSLDPKKMRSAFELVVKSLKP